MADAPRGGAGGARGGFGSRGDRGDRGRGRGGRRGPRRGGKSEEKEWQPVTKLGRLVKAGKIKSMEEIYLHSLPIKEYQIVDFFLPKLKDEVMKVSSDGLRCHAMSSSYLAFRSNPCKNKLVLVSVLGSRPSWSLGTRKGTLGWASRRPKKLLRPFAPPSSSPSSVWCPFAVVTGAPTSETPIPFPPRRAASADPLLSE